MLLKLRYIDAILHRSAFHDGEFSHRLGVHARKRLLRACVAKLYRTPDPARIVFIDWNMEVGIDAYMSRNQKIMPLPQSWIHVYRPFHQAPY
jgi:hypothetical protein